MVEGGDAELASAGDRNVRKEADDASKPTAPDGEQVTGLPSNSNGSKVEKKQDGGAEKKPSKVKEIWGKVGLDIGTAMMMLKGSLAPTIAVAFYQSDSVASTYSTLGYLVPIISVLSIPIMPRAKFFQTLILNIIGICAGSSVALLGIWSGIQARKHTTPLGSKERYNSSQNAVCAIWLFANIWFVNVLRAKMPALQMPVIMFSIFTNVAFTYGPLFQTIAEGEALIRQLLTGFLTAYAISTGVHLFIVPVSSRTVVFKEQAGYIGLIRAALKAQTAYLQSLENTDMFDGQAVNNVEESEGKEDGKMPKKKHPHPAETPQAKALKTTISGLTALHGKLHGDIPFGKRETAWGKLNAKDLDEIFRLFRGILIPLIGMSTISDIFERIAERRGWVKPHNPGHRDQTESWEHCPEEERLEEKKVWNEVMKALHEPFSVAVAAMDEAMEHAGLVLEILPKPTKKKSSDEEEKGAGPKPGESGFTAYMQQKMMDFYSKRGGVLRAWAKEKGLSEDQFNARKGIPTEGSDYTPDEAKHRRDQQQLYLILYMEHLLYSTGTAITEFVQFADGKIADGSMKKNRLIVPGQRRIKKWILSVGREDTSVDTESPDSMEAGANNVYLGSGFDPKKDPEHLPPATAWQHFGNIIRTIPRFLGSTESAFGFRVACATLTVGIVGFLKDSQTFFVEQRLVWAMIIIAIGMTITSGQSMFGFFGRVAGTTLSMIASIVIWYIVDQKTPGVIVMLWFFIFLEMFFFLKFPRFISVWLVTIVTQVLIIGYELQVRKLGIAAASATGQPYYPIYELGPYRLACVAGGSFVAFIWTIFPFPLSDRSWIRKDLGNTLYMLANYYAIVSSTINARLHGTEGNMELKSSPGRQLQKVRHKVFGKLMLLLPSLQQHTDWQKWEPTIGGKFPKETYQAITTRSTNILNYLTLMSYATQSWTQDGDALFPNTTHNSRRAWLDDLSTLVDSVGATSHHITSVLSLLSASVKQGSALPPHLELPQPYNLSRRLEALDKGILDSRHVEEPGYSAYAVLQVASSLITDDLARLVDSVRDLVGETDFSFAVSMSDSTFDSTESERNSGKGKKD